MRTTVDLPVPLFRRAKARAAARGETLRSLLTRAVTAEVGGIEPGHEEAASPRRVKLPLFGTPRSRKTPVTSGDVARVLAAEDVAAARRLLIRRPRSRR